MPHQIAQILARPHKIWVDGDACPREVVAILERACQRVGIDATFVSNKWLRLPSCFTLVQVSQGADVADHKIVSEATPGDLVLTADIPLAALLVQKKILALNFRGELYTASNMSERLSMRDFMSTLRETGVNTGGPRPYDARAKQAFSASLDRYLQQWKKSSLTSLKK